jgi:hypothetical protein
MKRKEAYEKQLLNSILTKWVFNKPDRLFKGIIQTNRELL